MVIWKDNAVTPNVILSFFFPQLLSLNMMSLGLVYPFGWLGSAVLTVSPTNFLCTPSLLTGWVM